MILVALGANLPSSEGAPRETLKRAIDEIAALGLKVAARSRVYLTEPVPRAPQPWYANQVIAVDTADSPADVLSALFAVETLFGRERSERNAARTLDLDLIAYHDLVLEAPALTLPHPRMHERAFVLAPLAEIAPGWRHPVLGQTVETLLAASDRSNVRALAPVPLVMGVVNVTPDSFSDGGRFAQVEGAIAHAVTLMEQGADILDIGGESTRPYSEIVPPEVEQGRILPVIAAIAAEAARRKRLVSVDTRNPDTMARALAAGATMINDITALDSEAARRIVAEAGVPAILMHMQGTPQTMQINPSYADVVQEIADALARARDRAIAAGIVPERIWLDPGLGFGKTLEHNFALLDATPRFKALGHKVLIGASRKGFIDKVDREGPADRRIGGSLAAALASAVRGADAVRVHDVAETRQALAMWSAIEGRAMA